jgi:exportin-T
VPLSSATTSDMEAALRLVYHYCEGIRPPPGLKVVMTNDTFRAVLVALHQSDITDHVHPEVLVLYYDTSVRYYPIFLDQPELLPKVLENLSGKKGLQHSHPRLSSRSCYLLLRLVKSVIQVMRPYVETAVTGIQGEGSALYIARKT